MVADYKFIGGDGKEYGPYSAEQMRQFMAENRLAAHSRVSADGGPFQPASNFSELKAPTGTQTPRPITGQPMDARQQVNGPALFMLISASLNIVLSFVGLVLVIGLNTAAAGGGMQTEGEALFGIITSMPKIIFDIIGSIFIVVGAMKMRKLDSYGLAMTASIFSILCCPCCVGFGAGIWSLVVLSDEQVKSAFAANRA
jgi:hypothetical protein